MASRNVIALKEVPIVPLRGGAVFPGVTTTVSIGRRRSLAAAQAAVEQGGELLILVQYNSEQEIPANSDLVPVGIFATVRDVLRAPQMGVQMLVELHRRVQFDGLKETDPHLTGYYSAIPAQLDTSDSAIIAQAIAYLEQYADTLGEANQQVMGITRGKRSAGELADYMAGLLNIPFEMEIELLTCLDGLERLQKIVNYIQQELRITEVRNKIQQDARSGADKAQREFLLREQMKAIQRELGERDEQGVEIEEFRKKIEEAKMPEEADKQAKRELDRLSRLPTAAAEYGVIRTYLDTLVSLPWATGTEDNLDISHARQVLNKDHYGLEDVKDRILEFLAIRKLRLDRINDKKEESTDLIRREREGVILCFVGPPGVGKTSLGQSIAHAMGRKFIRASLGGVRDEAEIRGHRRTYIGAMPGRILQSLRRIGSRNPVFMLDEVDKLTNDFHGDPSSALLEVLDPEQNGEFRDNYLEVAYDLSQVFFIATANTLEYIPGPLRDRMEMIYLSGYTESEKMHIARGYLIPRQIRENSLRKNEVTFSDEALKMIIRQYTREAGVRNLERKIGAVCRKVGTHIAEGKAKKYRINPKRVETFLDTPIFLGPEELNKRTSIPGVVPGLAWTSFGGDVMLIEATAMPGGRGFQITGSVGNVMQESARAALSYVRSRSEDFSIPHEYFDKHDIHMHVPAGSTPKDGPSAGITMAASLISLITGRKANPQIGMTGEITLRGQVLPIGGVKEKVLAAHRSGLSTVILPKQNEKDLDDVPDEIRKSMKFVFAESVDDVISAALEKPKGKKKKPGKTAKPKTKRAKKNGKTKNPAR
ncbi:MAG: endopeptidase La [Chloroflexi bacterium]|nr:MAG: endopeptidase La [Chloroflexota bacterium]